MTINLKKTVVVYQSAPAKTHILPSIYIYGSKLKVVDKFEYLGSTLSSNNALDNEIALRICKASEIDLEDLTTSFGDAEEYTLGPN